MPKARKKRKTASGIRSMTGFGRATGRAKGVAAQVEIRSLNHRSLRVGAKLPPGLASLETRVREVLAGGPSRGQIEVHVSVEEPGASGVPLPDPERVREYVEAWRTLGRELGLAGDLGLRELAAMPEVFARDEEAAAAERAWPAVERAVSKALGGLERMRAAEGGRLARDLSARLKRIEKAVGRIERRARASKAESAKRLRARASELVAEVLDERGRAERPVEEDSLEREIALRSCSLADRSDVSEEIERLRSHAAQFLSALEDGSPAGRKLEFLVQELQREVSTLGSKVSDPRAGAEAVDCRAELEKIREQAQNIE